MFEWLRKLLRFFGLTGMREAGANDSDFRLYDDY